MIAIAALPVGLTTGLGSSWVSVSAAKRLQDAKYQREDRNATDGMLDELQLAAMQFALSCHLFQVRWTDAASRIQKWAGTPRALRELATLFGPERERLFKAALQVTRWQGADRQQLKECAEDLLEAAGGLIEALGHSADEYEPASQKYQAALRANRQAIDAWDSRTPPQGWRLARLWRS